MKKLTILFTIIKVIAFSQTSTNWLLSGNAASSISYFGTNNAFPIDFRTNNVSRASLSTTGVFKINNLAGAGNRILQTDASGNISFLAAGTATQVLYGNGTWGALPATRTSVSCFSLAPFWTMGGDNFTATTGLTEASIGTCNNNDFIIKTFNANRVWFKTDGTIGFGTSTPSNSGGKEYKFKDGALRLSGSNTYGGPMVVFDGGLSTYGDWGIEYSQGAFPKSGLNFWKPFGSTNANNYLFYIADDGMVGVGTANPTSRLTVDAWGDNGLLVQANNTKKAISSFNKTTSKETFVVNADGKTIIGSTPATTDTMLVVNGTLKANNLIVNGTFTATKLKLGTFGTSDIGVSLTTLSSGARLLSFGTYEPLELSRTCIKPYSIGMISRFGDRVIITKSIGSTTSSNVLDIRNDSLNGYIDYGYDISIYPRFIDTTGLVAPVAPVPSLKINSACNGDVEIAKGGGFVSAGNYFEVGNPIRNGSIVSNIYATGGRVAQRITKKSFNPAIYTSSLNEYNTQFFVNRNYIKALSVFNTVTNSSGVETFVVYGDGKTYIGNGRPLSTGIAANAMLSVDGLVLAKELRVAISTTTHWADYVFDKNYSLMPLHELEIYITKNKHLPEVPSAKDVVKDGINVTDISATLLKKIEELTLYTIELQKLLEKQQIEINKLNK